MTGAMNKPRFHGERVRLEEVCIKGKSSLRQKDVMLEGPYPVYGASGIVGYLPSYQNGAPYVAVVKDGAGVGRACRCKGESSVLGTMQALIPSNDVDCSFLFHLVRSLRLGSGFSGSTIPHIYFKDYGKRIVHLPDLNGQRTIAAILDGVESIVAIRERYLAKLDDLRKSRFIEMFGDPVGGNAWPMRQLNELYRVGSSKRIYAKDLVKGGVPFYRLADVGCLADGTNPSVDSYITEERYAGLKAAGYVPGADDILVTSRGTLGKCYIVSGEDKFYFQDGMITWLARTGMSPRSRYLVALFSNNSFAKNLSDSCSGTTVRYLSISDLAKMRIPVPPMDLQDKYLAFVRQVDKLESAARASIDRLQTLYDSLAQEYFG